MDAHRQAYAAEGILSDHVLFVGNVFMHQRHPDGGVGRPAVRSRDAVLHGELLPLLGLEIFLGVGIQRVKNQPVKIEYVFDYGLHDSLRFRTAERAGDKVVLHIDDDKHLFVERLFHIKYSLSDVGYD
ncbi:hypothetical protein SDC9_111651 [bioreactor metagenome]|uniref:Uncharacterized protein n=1 Tax=bioreactor metagenome TaxID=1076179 RepID=A0A645BHL2_9ZZZZ